MTMMMTTTTLRMMCISCIKIHVDYTAASRHCIKLLASRQEQTTRKGEEGKKKKRREQEQKAKTKKRQ